MYGSVEALVERFGEVEVVRLSQIEDRETEEVNSAKVELALRDAGAVIDSYLRGRYCVPVVNAPQDLVRAACILARYDLAKSARSEPTEQMQRDVEAILKWLIDVKRGVAMLDAPLLGNVAGSGAFVSDRPPVFTPENLRGA